MEKNKHGAALMMAVAFLAVLGFLTAALALDIGGNWRLAKHNRWDSVSYWLAEAGIQKARAEIRKRDQAYTGETLRLGEGSVAVTVEVKEPGTYRVVSTGTSGLPAVSRTIEKNIGRGGMRYSANRSGR